MEEHLEIQKWVSLNKDQKEEVKDWINTINISK